MSAFPPTSRVEFRWNQPELGNRSLFRSKAPFSGNNNNLSLFWSPDLIPSEGTPTTHPLSCGSSRTTLTERQRPTGSVLSRLLSSKGTSTIHRRFLRSTTPFEMYSHSSCDRNNTPLQSDGPTTTLPDSGPPDWLLGWSRPQLLRPLFLTN